MRSVIAYFIKHVVLVKLLILIITIFGVLGFSSLTYSLFPEVSPNIILIEASWLGASPEEMEEGVVIKIEDNLRGVTGIDRVTSVSTENSAVITVELEFGEDANVLLQEINNEIDRIATLPPELERLVVYKQEVLSFTSRFALSGPVSLTTLKETAREIEDDLLIFPEISHVSLSGFPEEEIEISVSEQGLQAYGLSFEEVANAVAAANVEITGGTIKTRDREILIRADNKSYYAAGFEEIPVRSTPQGIVRLKDVAQIRDIWADDPERAFMNGTPSVIIEVETTNDENILEAADFVNSYIESFNEDNDIITATLIDDGSSTLLDRLEMLQQDGIIGAILVLIFLGLFLNLRVAFWVALSIPVSFLGMFALGAVFGMSINLLSLFGMIMVIGILVDDGVVVGENIYQHFEDGKPAYRAALDGAMEVMPSITSGIATTAVGFGFFFFVEGITGEYISDLSFVVIASLFMSLAEVFLLLPSRLAHSKALHANQRKPNRFIAYTSNLMVKLREKIYMPILKFFMAHQFFGTLIVFSAFVITFGAVSGGIIRTSFFPDIEMDRITATLEMPAGTRETITDSVLVHIEQAAREANQEMSAGRPDGEDIIQSFERQIGPSAAEGTLTLTLLDPEKRDISVTAISSAVRERAGEIHGVEQLSFETGIPFGKPVGISLSSRDIDELRLARDALRETLEGMPQLSDVVDDEMRGQPEIHIRLRNEAHLLGLALQDVTSQVRSGFFGREVQRLQRGQDEVIVWVRYDETGRTSIGELERMRIRTADGGEFPLREVAMLEEREGLTSINHRDGRRAITVEADVVHRGVSVPEVNDRVSNQILPEIKARYPGIDYSMEGQSREFGRTLDSIVVVLPAVVILMAAILVFTFRSFGQTFALVFITPFSFIGAAWGHWVHGIPFSLFSGLGVIALIGIMLNDGLVFINNYNARLKEGGNLLKALIQTGKDRFRPIFLTTITTVAGLTPLIMNPSLQAQFLNPMAVSVAYGLLVGSFLTLTMLPVLIILICKLRSGWHWIVTGQKEKPENLEPAIKEIKNRFDDEK
ncbi:efflux RND transporter permease subunit [Cytophagaceae bacterium ABcell3]|nr:efflux RND transporter permease subunit [Cytophagaceae bacterium ABcell3]